MSTKTRNLSNIDGANVTNPTANQFTSNGLEAFANDAAFAAQYTPVAGSIYWNTTEKCLREYNGTAWQYDKTLFSVQTDAATTGSNQDISPNTVDQVIRFTVGNTLVSVRSISPTNQKLVYLVNDQTTQFLTVVNQSAGATAANRIITGTNTDLAIEPGRVIGLIYDEDATRWRVISGDKPAGRLEVFANDAAYATAHPGTLTAGAIYWNSTSLLVRQYNGTAWQNDKTSYTTQTDSTTTGANQDITPGVDQLIRFTQGSLTSIRSISPATQSVISFINGQASQNITIVNESAGATAANRIVTGTNTDFTLKPGAAVGFVYDSAGSRWRLSSGGGGGGLQPVVKTANFTAEAGNNYLTDTTSGAIAVTLPSGADGSTLRFVDATEKWGTNNLTITPASGQTIDMLAANEALTCDVTRGWVELSWDGTRWAFSSLASTTVGEASASAPGIVSTGTQSFAGNKTFVGTITPSAGIVGQTSGAAITAGNVGEVITSASMSSGTLAASYTNITSASIALTAGVWKISYSVSLQPSPSSTAGHETIGSIQLFNSTDSLAISGSQRSSGARNPAAASFYIIGVCEYSTVVNIAGSKTYTIQGKNTNPAGTGSTTLLNSADYFSSFYAVRIA
jgi:hypothetical protein